MEKNSAHCLVIQAFEDYSDVRPITAASEIETLGLDSLETVAVMHQIESESGIEISDFEAAQFMTVGGVIAYVEARVEAALAR